MVMDNRENTSKKNSLSKMFLIILVVGLFITGVFLVLNNSSEDKEAHLETEQTNSKLGYTYYPDLKDVVNAFFENYAISKTYPLDLKFEKRPTGWHVAIYKHEPNKQKVDDRLFWCSKNRKYKTIEIDNIFTEPEETSTPEKFLNQLDLMHYRVCPYYGYPGWDWDVINEYRENKNLPDSILYGLGYAYSSYASNLLHDNSGLSHKENQFDLPDGKNVLTNEQIKKYTHYKNLAVEKFNEVAERTPSYQSFVGTIGIKAANERIASFLDMRIFQNEQEAQKHLFPNLYNDFYISVAKNYLATCAPNAILFTFGDNDTYPLLYVQTQYGFRTDVLVVNLSLLNTFRYINSLREKILDAEGIPLSVKPNKYQNGIREVLFVVNRLNRPVRVGRLLEFIWSDNPKSRIKRKDGARVDFLPSEEVFMTVDKEAIIESGTVNYEKKEQIVDTVEWTINQNYLMKSDLILLDILVSNQWERPIYFSSSINLNSITGIEDYLQLEGMAYRFVPIKKINGETQPGRVDTDILYRNLMENFEWGEMSNPDYINEYITIGAIYANIFSRLAMSLIDENKKGMAVNVIDSCLDIIPHKHVPFDAHILPLIEGYYSAGSFEKANYLCEKMIEVKEEALKHFFAKDTTIASMKNEAERDFAIMQRVSSIAKSYEQTKIAQRAEDVLARYLLMYDELQ